MEFNSNTELKGEEIMKLFVQSCLHPVGNTRVQWKNTAVCVGIVNMESGAKTLLVRQNTDRHHAEHGITQFVDENSKKISAVKIFCKYSPCSKPEHECCRRIREMKEKLMKGNCKEVNIDVVFSALYKINRPSCLKRGCFSGNSGGHHPTEESDGSIESLDSLGSSIRSFETRDWAELIELLALWDASRGVAGASLASIRYGEKYGNWRDFEDAELKRDFEILKQRLNGAARKREITLPSIDLTILEKEVSKIKEALAKFH